MINASRTSNDWPVLSNFHSNAVALCRAVTKVVNVIYKIKFFFLGMIKHDFMKINVLFLINFVVLLLKL